MKKLLLIGMIRRQTILLIALLIMGCGSNESIVTGFLDEMMALTPAHLKADYSVEPDSEDMVLLYKKVDIFDKYFSNSSNPDDTDDRMVGYYFINSRLISAWQIQGSEANRVTVYIKHTDRHQRNLLKLPDTETTVLFTIEDGIITKANPALKD